MKDPKIGWVCLWEFFSHGVSEKTSLFVKVPEPTLPAEQTVFIPPPHGFCLPLSVSLPVCFSLSVIVSCHVWVPSAVGAELPRPFEELLAGKQREKDLVPSPALGHD